MSETRVLVLIADSVSAGGGIAQYNRDLVRALGMATGVTARVVSYERRKPGSAFGFALRSLRTAITLRPQIVFCGHLHLAPLAALVARSVRARLWLQCHGVEAWSRPRWLRRTAARYASLVTCVSRYTRARVHSWLATEPVRLRVLPNTVDERFVATGDSDTTRSSPTLLTVGRLHPAERYKGHDRVISLLPSLRKTHPQIRYVIAGDGDDAVRLAELAKDLAVDDRVDFVGTVDGDRLTELYRAADLMVMPSTGEGFGIAYLESMASGTPALGLDCDGSADALGGGDLGVVARADALEASVRDALGRAIDRGSLSAATSRRFGRSHFERHVANLVSELAVR